MSDAFQIEPPTAEQQNPYLPPGYPRPFIFEEFAGINTSTTRSGVDDRQAWWLDGLMPIGRRFLRTMPDVGTPIHQESATEIISFFVFGNIGTTPYCIVFHKDGSIHAVNTVTLASSQIAAPGTITSPSRTNQGVSQWGSQYILIVSSQPNGYFIWDGTLFYQPGSLAPGVTVTNGGSGYTSQPTISVSGGTGSGATFHATISGGIIISIQITNPGTGYLATDAQLHNLTISGGGGASAAATVLLMPFAIQGTALEIYTGRVWIVNGSFVTFSSPGSFTDFTTGNGGGNFQSSDSFLRRAYIQPIQTNGFLYLIADSSVNYISAVQTSGSPPITTFTNQNADPEVGTPWAPSVTVFGRNIVFCNAFGAHISYGAAVTKISEPLDGVYNTAPNFGNIIPSSAKAIVFGKKIWMFLLPIIDPVTNVLVNQIFIWNGKYFWSSKQSVNLTYIQHQEIDSVLTAYGTDGFAIYPLFTTPSTKFTKVAQSKLWTDPGYQLEKATTRLWALLQYNSLNSPNLTVEIDNENEAVSASYTLGPATMNWVTAAGNAMNWTTQAGAAMTWTAQGNSVTAPLEIGQNGVMLGMTASTTCDDMVIVSLMIDSQLPIYRG